MVHFHTIRRKQASPLKENKLLLVHCVSKQPLVLIPDGLPCVELECRDVHVSFMDSLNVKRIALFPSMVNGVNIDEMFVDCDCHTLVEVHSSCVFKVNNSIGSIVLMGCILY